MWDAHGDRLRPPPRQRLRRGRAARRRRLRRILLEEIAGADRVVLLGDVVELRDLPLGAALEAARPFFEELGEALAGREVTIVPGNHDHRFAEPLLDELSLAGGAAARPRALDDPAPGPTARIDAWLGAARLRLAYPGLWLRDDVYATHGHYMDCHLSLPRVECVGRRGDARLRPDPQPGRPRRLRARAAPRLRLRLRPRPVAAAPASGAATSPPRAPGGCSPATTARRAGDGG